MRGRQPDRDSVRRRRSGFVTALAAACATLIIVLSPHLGRAIAVLSGTLQDRPLYPVRVDFPPTQARHVTNAVSGTTAALLASNSNNLDDVLPLAEEDESASRSGPTDAADRRSSLVEVSNILPLDFDISPRAGMGSFSSGGSQIDTIKPLSLNGVDAGSINVRVGGDSKIYLDRATLVRALRDVDGKVVARIAQGRAQPFLSLDDLRSNGVSVRYDPIGDRINLET